VVGILRALFLFARTDNTFGRTFTLRTLLAVSLRVFPRHRLRLSQDVVVTVPTKDDMPSPFASFIVERDAVGFIYIRLKDTLVPPNGMRLQTLMAWIFP